MKESVEFLNPWIPESICFKTKTHIGTQKIFMSKSLNHSLNWFYWCVLLENMKWVLNYFYEQSNNKLAIYCADKLHYLRQSMSEVNMQKAGEYHFVNEHCNCFDWRCNRMQIYFICLVVWLWCYLTLLCVQDAT